MWGHRFGKTRDKEEGSLIADEMNNVRYLVETERQSSIANAKSPGTEP
jgi:hypothetical protein